MSIGNIPRGIPEAAYAEAAREYLRSLPLEHFMEATSQATQRKITLESLDLVQARRSDVHLFNELLIQYHRPRQRKPGQVVPDNMVVLWNGPIKAEGSYDVPLQPVGPFWTLEYVSKHNRRKDYEDSFKKYEQALKVPYYLIFYPENEELTLYHNTGQKYRTVLPNNQERYAIPELDLELRIWEGWVRFWYQAELLPLPGDMQKELDEARMQARKAVKQAELERQRAQQEKERAEREMERADQENQRAEQEKHRADLLERELEKLRSQSSPPKNHRSS
jgi:Uma2 family endonuclease